MLLDVADNVVGVVESFAVGNIETELEKQRSPLATLLKIHFI